MGKRRVTAHHERLKTVNPPFVDEGLATVSTQELHATAGHDDRKDDSIGTFKQTIRFGKLLASPTSACK